MNGSFELKRARGELLSAVSATLSVKTSKFRRAVAGGSGSTLD